MLVPCTSLHAYDVEVDGVCYGVIGSMAYVTYRGSDVEHSEPYVGDVYVPEEITYRGKTYPVRSVGDNAFAGCEGLTSVHLPATLSSLSPCAFMGCSNLRRVYLSESVKVFSSCAFTGCTALQQVTLPRYATLIDSLTFYCCASLRSLILPHRVRTVCQGAIEHCPSMTHLYCFASEPPVAEQGAFTPADQRRCTLHVPRESLQQYKDAPVWSNFQRIVALDDSDYLAQGYVRGDVNDDGKVDAADLALLQRIIVRLPDDSAVRWAADFNGDGLVNAVDYVLFAAYLSK